MCQCLPAVDRIQVYSLPTYLIYWRDSKSSALNRILSTFLQLVDRDWASFRMSRLPRRNRLLGLVCTGRAGANESDGYNKSATSIL